MKYEESVPITALITGLMGLSGAWPASARAEVQARVVTAFPAEMPGAVAEAMRRVSRGEKLEAFGMQGLRRRMALGVERRLAGLAGERGPGKWVEVQLAEPKNGGVELVVAPAARMEKAAFFGVAASPAGVELRVQRGLPRGEGLVVEFVDRGSPAEKAGLQKGDVLLMLDEQVLINGEQMAVLVRNKKPGDKVKLVYLKGEGETGKEAVEVVLAEKELPVLEDGPRVLGVGGGPGGILTRVPELQGMTELVGGKSVGSSSHVDAAGTVTRRVVDDQNDITLVRTAAGKETLTVKDREGRELFAGPAENLAGAKLGPDLMKKIENVRANPMRVMVGTSVAGAVGDAGVVDTRSGASGVTTSRTFEMNRKDEQYDITLKSVNGDRHLTVKEMGTGKVVFDGAANSAEDLKKLPAEVEGRVQAMLERVK